MINSLRKIFKKGPKAPMNSIEIRDFDQQNAKIYAIREEDSEKLLGLVFQDPESPFSQVVTVSNVAELATIDLFDCATHIAVERIVK